MTMKTTDKTIKCEKHLDIPIRKKANAALQTIKLSKH